MYVSKLLKRTSASCNVGFCGIRTGAHLRRHRHLLNITHNNVSAYSPFRDQLCACYSTVKMAFGAKTDTFMQFKTPPSGSPFVFRPYFLLQILLAQMRSITAQYSAHFFQIQPEYFCFCFHVIQHRIQVLIHLMLILKYHSSILNFT